MLARELFDRRSQLPAIVSAARSIRAVSSSPRSLNSGFSNFSYGVGVRPFFRLDVVELSHPDLLAAPLQVVGQFPAVVPLAHSIVECHDHDPATRTKAKREHRLPLTRRAEQVLDAARAAGNGGPLVFPSGPL